MFIKRGDGKILSVMKTEEVTEEQKKASRELSEKSAMAIIDFAEPTPPKKTEE